MDIFQQLHESGQTILLVTHEEHLARHTHRIIRLLDGRVERDELLN